MARRVTRPLLAAALTLLLLVPLSTGVPARADGPERVPGARIELRASDVAAGTRVAGWPRRRSSQAATFVVNYDAGFLANQPARAAFQYAVDIWAGQLSSPVPIVVDAHWSALEPGLLGYAGFAYSVRDFAGAPRTGTYYPAPIANRLAGTDLGPDDVDIEASFSSNVDWYFGTDGNTPAGRYDFATVVLHELGHGLGFAGSGSVASGVGHFGVGVSKTPFIWDRFVVNGAGTPVLALVDGSLPLRLELTGANLFFAGVGANAGNGGAPARLYAPASWEQGSSYSHLDEATYPAGNANSLMTPQLGSAEAIHDPGPVVRGILEDMGWATSAPAATPTPTATAVPIPAAGPGIARLLVPLTPR